MSSEISLNKIFLFERYVLSWRGFAENKKIFNCEKNKKFAFGEK